MDPDHAPAGRLPRSLLFVVAFLLAIALMLAWRAVLVERNLASIIRDVAETRSMLASTTVALEAEIMAQQQLLVQLSDMLYNSQKAITDIAEELQDYGRDVGKLSGSVRDLEKLTTTDPQLLQKYSRVYFLNEHYVPADLMVIDEKFDYPNGKEVSIHSDVWPYLEDLLDEALDDGVDLTVLSGYRSFNEQATLKVDYVVRYGTGANTFSADQGYSEHQLGTSVDFTTNVLGENIDAFGETDAFVWLTRNAYKYGFVMSYPESNEYYVYEPWHWRFVGEKLARDLHRKGKNLYDLEQREIDKYLVDLFD